MFVIWGARSTSSHVQPLVKGGSFAGRAWTAQEVERAIFSAALSSKAGVKGAKTTGKGTKPAARAPASKRKAAADTPKSASKSRK